jgi:hypothetical protein
MEGIPMKRREIKFVAGSLQLSPDRIASALRKPAAGRRTGASRARLRATKPIKRTSTRKRG